MSLLNKATKQITEARRAKNAVVQVIGYELNEHGTSRDQVLIAVDLDTSKQIKIVMGTAVSATAEAQRTTIVDLAQHVKRHASAGGFVRVDGLHMASDGLYEARFVKTLKSSPNDSDRHFFKMKTRAFPSRSATNNRYGGTTVSHYARLELLDDSPESVKKASTGEELKTLICKMLLEGTQWTQSLGDNTVFMRDSPFAKTFSLRAKSIKIDDGGQYRKPSAEEIATQVSQMEIVGIVAAALDEAQGGASVDLMPGASHMVVGKTASGKEYANQAEVFFKGTFKAVDEESGELKSIEATGFREAVVGMTRHTNDRQQTRWFVNNVSATQTDALTLNGLRENSHERKGDTKAASQSQPANSAPHQMETARPNQSSQPQKPVQPQQPMHQATHDQMTSPQSLPNQPMHPQQPVQQSTYGQAASPQAQPSQALPPHPQDVQPQSIEAQYEEHSTYEASQSYHASAESTLDDLMNEAAADDDDLVARAASAFNSISP